MTKAEAKAIHSVLKRAYESLGDAMRSIEPVSPSMSMERERLSAIASDVYLVLSMASEELS